MNFAKRKLRAAIAKICDADYCAKHEYLREIIPLHVLYEMYELYEVR